MVMEFICNLTVADVHFIIPLFAVCLVFDVIVAITTDLYQVVF
jgi:hypothetical protein